MPSTRRSLKKNCENLNVPAKKTSSPKNRNQQQQNLEKPCYILLYKCFKNNDILIPIYIDEKLGEKFIENMDKVKVIEIVGKTFITYAKLRYAKKCCKQVCEFMSKINSKIYPELTSKVFEKLGGDNLINRDLDNNDEDVVFDYQLEKRKQIVNENIFKFDWNMDELTKTETTWDLIEWDYEKQDYTYYQDKDKEEEEQDKLASLFEEIVYESDEDYEDKNKRMQFRKYI